MTRSPEKTRAFKAIGAMRLVWAVAGVAGVTVLLRALSVTDTTIAALSYILVILVVATRAPLSAAVVTSLLAIVPFHFYFVPVIESFEITDPLNWVVLGSFLTVGIVAGELATSARYRAERERAAELAVQRAELSSALLASLSHDLRTPLAATRVAIANLNDEHLSAAERQRQATVALEQVIRLDRNFHGILDLARIEAKGLKPEREWVTPAEIVEAALNRTGAAADQRVVVDADDSVEANLDPRLTAAALTYVIENALQYSPAAGTINLRGWSQDGGIHFSVMDEGPGFDETDADRIFDAFYRGQAASQVRQGVGLGLTIARGLLNAEGGAIKAERVEPHGARFHIILPCAQRATDLESGSP